MLKKIFIPLTIIAAIMSACNSKNTDEYEYISSSSVIVNGFSLCNDQKVLDSLSNVYFSIDLVNARIFNADSLPYGTNITKLVPVISTPSNVSAVTVRYYEPKVGRDSVVNWKTSSSDSINFTRPVTLTVTSESGAVSRDYQIKVNVHTVKPDTLAWYSMESAPLPSTFNKVSSQCTAMLNGTYYCLTSDGTNYCLATTTTPDRPRWQTKAVTFGFSPVVESLRTSDSALYMLDTDGNMYTSADFATWSLTGQKWHYIIGGYEDSILGTAKDGNGVYSIVEYPSGKSWTAPADFPVENTSTPCRYATPMGLAPQMVISGGRLADGSLSDQTWGYDGTEWANTTLTAMPEAVHGHVMVAYKLAQIPSTTWTPIEIPVLMVFGGYNSKGQINRDVMYSRDWGMNWAYAPESVQLPDDMPSFADASGFVYDTMMHASRSAYWDEVALRPLPRNAGFIWPVDNAASRAVKPVSEWECPAIYMFGGKDAYGNTMNTLWRGVILLYTMKPVQ